MFSFGINCTGKYGERATEIFVDFIYKYRECAAFLRTICNIMAKKLYVGGVPYSSTDADLKAHFEECGPVVSATIIMDKMTGRSKGFGFVEMENDADAMTAIDKFNNQDFQGRKLTVSEARPQERRF